MRRELTAFGAVLVLGLAACGAADDPAPSPDDPPTSVPLAAETPFAQAMSRVSSDALGEQPFVEFGQTATLLELSNTDERWLGITTMGNRLLVDQSMADAIGVDATAAEYGIDVGIAPSRIALLAGGQDPELITDTATQSGYDGTDVLTQSMTPSVPVTISVQQIKPIDSDVALASADADVGWVDSGSLFADEQVGPVAVCLGDVLAATIAELDGEIVGVGVRAEGDAIISVLCLPGGDDAIADAETDLDGPDFVDRLEIVESETVDALAKVSVEHTANAPAILLFAALANRDLPGA